MALATDEGAGEVAGSESDGTETGETGEGDNTQVTVPGTDPACTHDQVTVVGHNNGTHDWICDTCGEQHLNEFCSDVDGDGRCGHLRRLPAPER